MIEDGFHPCRECGMPMVEEWSNVDGDYLRCTWCGFEREWLGGRKVLRHGNPEEMLSETAINDNDVTAAALRLWLKVKGSSNE